MSSPEPAHDLAALARRYVDLSNSAALNEIETLLADDVTYHSDAVGQHAGRPAVMAMMRAFFAGFSKLHWAIEKLRAEGAAGMAFDFVLTGEKISGEKLLRNGYERLDFNARGEIYHVEVRPET